MARQRNFIDTNVLTEAKKRINHIYDLHDNVVSSFSGGKDSAALAIYMAYHHPELDIEYFFTDTGEELPEVYSYLVKLEGFLGKTICRITR